MLPVTHTHTEVYSQATYTFLTAQPSCQLPAADVNEISREIVY